MACRKHGYKGNKPCRVCEEENLPYRIAFYLFAICFALAYWYVTLPLVVIYLIYKGYTDD